MQTALQEVKRLHVVVWIARWPRQRFPAGVWRIRHCWPSRHYGKLRNPYGILEEIAKGP